MQKKATADNKVVPMFSHLPAYSKLATAELGKSKNRVHPLVVQLGLRYADGIISGGNSRTLALLTVLKKVYLTALLGLLFFFYLCFLICPN